MDIILIPAVLSTIECHGYVKSKPVWDELEAIYGDKHLRPLRSTSKNKSYLRETIDKVLRLAESEGTLLNRPLVEAAMKRRKKQITDLSEKKP